MATLRKRNGKWQVQIRPPHQSSINRSFIHKSHAQQWARKVEAEIDVKGLLPDTGLLKRHTLLDLINRYLDQVIPVAISHDTIAHSLRVIEAILSGLSLKSFHAAQQASTISSWFWKTRMASLFWRRYCQTFSTGFNSGA